VVRRDASCGYLVETARKWTVKRHPLAGFKCDQCSGHGVLDGKGRLLRILGTEMGLAFVGTTSQQSQVGSTLVRIETVLASPSVSSQPCPGSRLPRLRLCRAQCASPTALQFLKRRLGWPSFIMWTMGCRHISGAHIGSHSPPCWMLEKWGRFGPRTRTSRRGRTWVIRGTLQREGGADGLGIPGRSSLGQ